MRVLIVEDDDGVREVLRSLVAVEGYESVEAASAEEALALARQEEFAIALCDICLPGKDGLWFVSELTFIRPDTAIVVATGVQDIDTAVRSLRTGAVDYLVKPFSRSELAGALQRAHYAYVANRAHANTERTLKQRESQLAAVVAELRQNTSLLTLAHNLVIAKRTDEGLPL